MKKQATPLTKPTEEVFSALLVVTVLLILPQLGGIAMMIGSTVGFALYVSMFPDRFRTRSGSLKPAIGLGSFLAILTAVILVMSLTHQIK